MVRHPHVLAWVALLAALAAPAPLGATVVSLDLGFDRFGHLANSGPRCQATATVNSWQYLRTRYPEVYGPTRLIQGSLAHTRDLLANGWTNAAGVFRPGALGCGAAGDESIWEHKNLWIQDFAPGTTVIKGMADPRGYLGKGPAEWNFRERLVDAPPTADFLLAELRHGEDVELAIAFADGAHMVTLFGFTHHDDDDDGRWSVGEMLALDYIDPNNPNQRLSTGNLVLNSRGRLEFLWDNGSNPATVASIRSAFSESPRVAAPPTLLLVLAALAAWAVARRRSAGRGRRAAA